MSVILDDNIVAIWYLQIARDCDWLASLTAIPGEPDHFALTYRFRYYTDPTGAAWDSSDVKNWYSGIATGGRDHCIATMRHAVNILQGLNNVPDNMRYECLNDNGLDDFMNKFSQLPFVHMKVTDKDGKEIPEAPPTNKPGGIN